MRDARSVVDARTAERPVGQLDAGARSVSSSSAVRTSFSGLRATARRSSQTSALPGAGSVSPPSPSGSSRRRVGVDAFSMATESATGLVVNIRKWQAVGLWTWNAETRTTCSICRVAFDACPPDAKFPGDDSHVVWGQCGHAFLQCITKWLNSQAERRCHRGARGSSSSSTPRARRREEPRAARRDGMPGPNAEALDDDAATDD